MRTPCCFNGSSLVFSYVRWLRQPFGHCECQVSAAWPWGAPGGRMGPGSELYPPPPQGDGNIRYYEVSADKPHLSYLTEYRSHSPQKGMGEYGTLGTRGVWGDRSESDEGPTLERTPFRRAEGGSTRTLWEL